MNVTKTPGPERPTLIERFVDLIPGPYPLGCLILSLLLGFSWRVKSSLEAMDIGPLVTQ